MAAAVEEQERLLPGFCSARILLANDRHRQIQETAAAADVARSESGEEVEGKVAADVMSPGFRSAAAMAGWDFDAILQATLSEEEHRLPTPQGTPEPVREERNCTICSCGLCPACNDRKRPARTPSHAITPASANRRHRRHRTQIIDHSSMDLPSIGLLNLASAEDDESTSSAAVDQPQRVDTPSHCLQPDEAAGSVKEGEEVLQEQGNQSSARNSDVNDDAKPAQEARNHVPADLACMDQLREELSCAVCLDICFEPSTTSCGHSFCRICLRSAIDRCGSRCPKCRQNLRGEVKWCPLNTTLWNTIQLLFPTETSARVVERGRLAAESASSSEEVEEGVGGGAPLSTAVSRAVRSGPWRNPTPPVRPPPPPPAFLPPLTPTSLSPPASRSAPLRLYFSMRRARSQARSQQEEDRLLARRLQNQELRLAGAREEAESALFTAPSSDRPAQPLYAQNAPRTRSQH